MAFTPPHQLGLPLKRKSPRPIASNSHRWDPGRVGGGGGALTHLASLLPLGGTPGSLASSSSLGGGPSSCFSLGLGDERSDGPDGDFGSSAAESKRLKRLEKNRESARECRRRKKELKEQLEVKLAALEEENLSLRLQLKVGDEAEDAENSEIKEIKGRLDDMVSRGVSEGQILQTMDLLKERYADYGSVHTSAAEFHLDQLSRLLLPTLTTRACMHALLQSASAAPSTASADRNQRRDVILQGVEGSGPGGAGSTEEAVRKREAGRGSSPSTKGEGDACGDPTLENRPGSIIDGREARGEDTEAATVAAEAGVAIVHPVGVTADPDPQGGLARDEGGGDESGEVALVDMWSSLVEVLEATEDQQSTMRSQAGVIVELARDLEETTEILRRLKLLLEDRNQTLDGEMAEIQRILTPTQTAKFVLWVSKNRACVHMLNHLWDKLHGDP